MGKRKRARTDYANQITAKQEPGRTTGQSIEAARRFRGGLVVVALKEGRKEGRNDDGHANASTPEYRCLYGV